ncbi:cupin domain-containing protein [Rhizobium lemnae]|uniref:Cupin domain-containing protein n=1 Tax=Rhizobium lemnae TaxID=1214924 RepID=A0ABV8E4I2_9HYPH|nr:cupin domain-containing protein [Rhizobium lemnae]MCJ8508023.1 cupin domain-containing protein [Rhizobium lemnae]
MVLKLALAGALALAHRRRIANKETVPTPFIGASNEHLVRDMVSSPIEPSWILSGNPQARVAYQSIAADKCASTAMWDCTAGSFRWFFAEDETVVILEGEVFITAADGTQKLLRAGDVGYFTAGTWATWRIDHYVRKIAFMRQPLGLPMSFFYRMRRRIIWELKGRQRNL